MIHYKDENDLWNIPFCAPGTLIRLEPFTPGWMPQHEVSAEELTHDADQVGCPDCLEAMAALTIQALEQDAQDTITLGRSLK